MTQRCAVCRRQVASAAASAAAAVASPLLQPQAPPGAMAKARCSGAS
ncbi:MAG: hypothetical protein IPJ52_12515 [Rhodocyclaceae bacterium]|nr:hypothetical protein [Rhodocyclaceae bacterium]